MEDTIHEVITSDNGTHILIYHFDGVEYVFERKIFVDAIEYRKGH